MWWPCWLRQLMHWVGNKVWRTKLNLFPSHTLCGIHKLSGKVLGNILVSGIIPSKYHQLHWYVVECIWYQYHGIHLHPGVINGIFDRSHFSCSNNWKRNFIIALCINYGILCISSWWCPHRRWGSTPTKSLSPIGFLWIIADLLFLCELILVLASLFHTGSICHMSLVSMNLFMVFWRHRTTRYPL